MICSLEIKNRMKRTSGQMQGVIKMIDDEISCNDIVVQLKAIRASVDKVIALMTTEHLLQVLDHKKDENEEVQNAINLIIKGIV